MKSPLFSNEQLRHIIDRSDDAYKEMAPYMAAAEARDLAVAIQDMRRLVFRHLKARVSWQMVPMEPLAVPVQELAPRRRVITGPSCQHSGCEAGAVRPGLILCDTHLKKVSPRYLKEFTRLCRRRGPASPRRKELSQLIVEGML